MNKNKSRTDMLREAITIGREEAEYLRLEADYRNWSPLNLWCYLVGVLGGLLGAIGAVGLWISIYVIISFFL